MNLKSASVQKFWDDSRPKPADYSKIDASILQLFNGTHPQTIQGWLPAADRVFEADPNHRLIAREKKHRLMLKLEQWFGCRFSKKHYKLIR